MSAEHWLWWGAGFIVGTVATLAAVWVWRPSRDPHIWREGYDAGVRAVKASRSRAAKAGHETRRGKRESENVVRGPVTVITADEQPRAVRIATRTDAAADITNTHTAERPSGLPSTGL